MAREKSFRWERERGKKDDAHKERLYDLGGTGSIRDLLTQSLDLPSRCSTPVSTGPKLLASRSGHRQTPRYWTEQAGD